VASVLMIACENQTHPVFSPVPSPTPHTAPTAAILQSSDVPPTLSVCLGSGPIDVYIATLGASGTPLADKATSQWAQLVSEGARGGAISIYVSSTTACKAELGSTTSAKSIASFVAQFGDEGEADRAWQSGVFGFAPPPTGEVVPGLTRGPATGLGLSSFTYDRPSVGLASWRRSVFVALVVATNLDPTTLKAATAAIDPRLN
jgi:hypothetical protein